MIVLCAYSLSLTAGLFALEDPINCQARQGLIHIDTRSVHLRVVVEPFYALITSISQGF